MKLKFISTFWGKEHLPISEFVKISKEEGYDGLELNIPDNIQFVDELKNTTRSLGMDIIAQQWLPPLNESVDEYKRRMVVYLKRLATIKPLFINSHTGKDYFTFEDNCNLIEACFEIEKETDVPIVHETHRGRFNFHAYTTLKYIEKYKNLYINADFSHFCNVSESLLEDQIEIVSQLISRSKYIHARVGFDQSAQVNDPFAPEWKPNLDHFLSWWQQIIDNAKKRGEDVFYICPEFGPYPYMPQLPYTQKPVADQWKINSEMKDYLKENLNS